MAAASRPASAGSCDAPRRGGIGTSLGVVDGTSARQQSGQATGFDRTAVAGRRGIHATRAPARDAAAATALKPPDTEAMRSPTQMMLWASSSRAATAAAS